MTRLSFVCCVNQAQVARDCLLASPCLQPGHGHQLVIAQGMGSAGEGFRWGRELARHPWLVLLHQDVFLPPGWDEVFVSALQAAERRFARLAAAGVYGVRANGTHVGHVYDRDRWLGHSPVETEQVRSLDELLLAVHRDSGLAVAPELGWHLYGTDLCLQAEAAGQVALVLDAPCEHRSALPRTLQAHDDTAAAALQTQVDAFNRSARVLAARWPTALPVTTAVATIEHGSALGMEPR